MKINKINLLLAIIFTAAVLLNNVESHVCDATLEIETSFPATYEFADDTRNSRIKANAQKQVDDSKAFLRNPGTTCKALYKTLAVEAYKISKFITERFLNDITVDNYKSYEKLTNTFIGKDRIVFGGVLGPNGKDLYKNLYKNLYKKTFPEAKVQLDLFKQQYELGNTSLKKLSEGLPVGTDLLTYHVTLASFLGDFGGAVNDAQTINQADSHRTYLSLLSSKLKTPYTTHTELINKADSGYFNIYRGDKVGLYKKCERGNITKNNALNRETNIITMVNKNVKGLTAGESAPMGLNSRSGVGSIDKGTGNDNFYANWPWQTVPVVFMDNCGDEPWAGYFSGTIGEVLFTAEYFLGKTVEQMVDNATGDDQKNRQCIASLGSALLTSTGFHSAIEVVPVVKRYLGEIQVNEGGWGDILFSATKDTPEEIASKCGQSGALKLNESTDYISNLYSTSKNLTARKLKKIKK
jgi:hypothetical protein